MTGAGAYPEVKVLVIMGWTRSGSTILDNLLGEMDGFFSTGELHYLWKRGLLEQRLCGCGAEVRDCELWSAVLAAAAARGLDPERDARDIVAWQHRAVRVRHTFRLLRQQGAPTGWAPLDAYIPVATTLYKAIAEVTGARVVVDSSKRPSDGALLHLLPGVDPYFVQLVRDPRAVAYSWQRHKREPDWGRERALEMPRYGPLYSTLGWVELNLAAEAVRRRHDPARSLLVRYEDFVAEPRATLARIAEMVGERPQSLPVSDDNVALLNRNHAVSGNPTRFKTGEVPLRYDSEWTSRLNRRARLVTTALARPLLRRYGYVIKPHAREPRATTGIAS
jgi:hypothetical protein